MLKLKNILAGTGISVVLSLSVIGIGYADFNDAVKAYEIGDYNKALLEWKELAKDNDPAAMRNVGHIYRRGLGVDQDFAKAMHWYKRAATMGFDRAQANVASMYLRGQGVPQDYVKAAEWFTKAARNGHTIAQYNLGIMYEHGKGIEKSTTKALAWYNLAAKAGHKQALNKVSILVAGNPDIKEDVAIEQQSVAADPKPAPITEKTSPVVQTAPEPAKKAEPEIVQAKPAPEKIIEPVIIQTAATPEKAMVPASPRKIVEPEQAAKKFDPFATSANNLETDKTEKSGVPTAFSTASKTMPAATPKPEPVVAEKPNVVAITKTAEQSEKTTPELKQIEQEAEPVAVSEKVENPEPEESKGFFSALKSLVMGDDEEKSEAVEVAKTTAVVGTTAAVIAPKPVSTVQVTQVKSVESVHIVPGSGLSVPERLEMASLSFAVEEYQQALSVWAPLAQDGNAEAQYQLGKMFFEGYAVPIDRVKAYQWWAKARDNGSTVATKSLEKLATSLTFLEKRRLQHSN